MSDAVIAALITGGLSLVGVVVTVLLSNRGLLAKLDKQSELADEKLRGEIAVVKTEITELRNEVQKHNNVVERVYKLEQDSAVHAEKIAVANHRIEDLEKTGKE